MKLHVSFIEHKSRKTTFLAWKSDLQTNIEGEKQESNNTLFCPLLNFIDHAFLVQKIGVCCVSVLLFLLSSQKFSLSANSLLYCTFLLFFFIKQRNFTLFFEDPNSAVV
jgi:hypothetical protein